METLLPVIAILFVGAITPGPNNLIVLAAGARGGLRVAGPLMAGAVLGALTLLAFVWTGVAVILDTAPYLRTALTVAGSAYLVWLGVNMVWQTIRRSDDIPSSSTDNSALPGTWFGVAAFQFLNPKAWVLIVTVTAALSREIDGALGLVMLGSIFVFIMAPCMVVWAFAGSVIGRFLNNSRSKLWFDRTMGILLVASAGLLITSVN